MDNINIQIIANPTARSGKAKTAALYVLQKLKEKYASSVNLTFTQNRNDATHITSKAINNGTQLIISVGGDGTINEVVNGFFINGKPINPACELGIINCGTGGGLAHALHIPKSLDQQIELIFQSQSVDLDVGHITYLDSSNNLCSRFFINECQLGIGSKVASLVDRKYKILGAQIAFGIVAAIQALLLKPQILEITFDNEPTENQNIIGFVVGNGSECGGGMKLTPDAKLNDGFLDVLLIREMNTVQRLRNFSKIYTGEHISSPYCSIRKCKKIAINSNIVASIEADGEILGKAPCKIEVLPAAIRVKAVF